MLGSAHAALSSPPSLGDGARGGEAGVVQQDLELAVASSSVDVSELGIRNLASTVLETAKRISKMKQRASKKRKEAFRSGQVDFANFLSNGGLFRSVSGLLHGGLCDRGAYVGVEGGNVQIKGVVATVGDCAGAQLLDVALGDGRGKVGHHRVVVGLQESHEVLSDFVLASPHVCARQQSSNRARGQKGAFEISSFPFVSSGATSRSRSELRRSAAGVARKMTCGRVTTREE